MAVTMKASGMEAISEMLQQMEEAGPKAAAAGLYDGAAVIAGEIKAAAGSIKTEPFHYAKDGQRLPSPEEKEIIQNGIGVATFDKNGSEINTSVGYGNAGYAELDGKEKPVALVANAINSGTSFMRKQPFIRKSANSGKQKAEAAIRETVERRLDEIIRKNTGG